MHKKIDSTNDETGVTSELNTIAVRSSYGLANIDADDSSVSEDLIAEVKGGAGMEGPDGKRYGGVDWNGVISRSNYGMANPDIHYTFPPERLTLLQGILSQLRIMPHAIRVTG